MLETKSLCVRFNGVSAVVDVSLCCRPGTITAIVGANGAGKSSLLNAITGIVRPSSGEVFVDGIKITNWLPAKIARQGVFRTWQRTRLAGQMTLLENVIASESNPFGDTLLAAVSRRGYERDRENRACAVAILERIGLAGSMNHLAKELSFGQRTAAAVAAAYASSAKVKLLDEPFAGVSPQLGEKVEMLMHQMRDAGQTLILVEHDLDVVRRLASTVVVMQRGRAVLMGDTDSVLSSPDLIHAFL